MPSKEDIQTYFKPCNKTNQDEKLKSSKRSSSPEVSADNSELESDEPKLFLPKCNYCGLKFLCEESLERHKNSNNLCRTQQGFQIGDVHVTDRNFKCQLCPFAYTTKAHLKRHEEIHSDSKKKQRAKVQKQYIQRTAVQRDEFFDFKLCSKTFKDKRSLYGHNYYSHPKEKFQCDYCDIEYKTKSNLKRHVRNHVKDDKI